jgi:hypothetical protein
MTTKRKLAPPTPKPCPRTIEIVREIESFRDYLSVELGVLPEEDVASLTTPLWSLYHLTSVELNRRRRESQAAAILQAPREDWTN